MGRRCVSYLLDTHALLWALTEPASLGAQANHIIADADQRLVVSAATAWEISTKQRLGRLPQADGIVSTYTRNIERLGASELQITAEHALLAGRLDWDHRDPFDRMLAAQAMTESLTLITKDAAFATLPGIRTLW